jgi:hypothetical protein
MQEPIDSKKTVEVIERLKLAKIGEYKKWESLIKKIQNDESLNADDLAYFTNFSRIYKNAQITHKTKMYHTKLSENDEKPPCKECGEDSLYYCNMNDAYFCPTHVVGHDDNEL